MARRGVGHADAELHETDCYARMERRAEPLRARRFADLEEGGLGERDLPESRPCTLDRILDLDFLPANRHGLVDVPSALETRHFADDIVTD